MRIYSQTDNYILYEGSMLDLGEVIADNSIDSIVTDPPYELNFMGKGWDRSGIAFSPETWRRCYNALKPGGHLLAFGGSRTFHRNDAENTPVATVYEERVALNEWRGWGTSLKPAYEPIIVARKPCASSCIDNVLTYGVGGINIDECRIDHDEPVKYTTRTTEKSNGLHMGKFKSTGSERSTANPAGRFPSNVLLTYDDTDRAEVCGGMPETKSSSPIASDNRANIGNSMFIDGVHTPGNSYNDEGSASRYFYTAKASPRDRDEGLEVLASRNIHPSVKPTDLMQYLVRLVTPRGGTVLDPFNGSGSTGKACMFENKDRDANYKYIGIELTPEYLPIAEARIKFAARYTDEITEEQQKGQLTIFDILGGAS